MNSPPDADASQYPIGVVTRRTGLSADVLRVWERRYAVVSPNRSAGGQRLYSAEDLERLRLLRRIVEGGHRIAAVAKLAMPALERLAAEVDAGRAASGSPRSTTVELDTIRRDALGAVEELEGTSLEAMLKRAALSLSTEEWIDGVIAPFLAEVGDRWHEGSITPAHEHLASATTREVLAWVARSFLPAATAPTIVVGTLSGEQHELGAMMACVIAAEAGWRVQYLGPNLPAESLAAAARQLGARAIAVSIVYPDAIEPAIDQLRRLRAAAPAAVAIIVGGAGAEPAGPALAKVGATYVVDTASLRVELAAIMRASA